MRKKIVVAVMAAIMTLAILAPATTMAGEGSGAGGFFAGCCFGLRTGADFNDLGTGERTYLSWFLVGICLGPRTAMDYRDGKEYHWREIARVIPYVGGIFWIWDGIDISSGKGRSDLQETYGATYY